jgi:hypothetical protein
MLKREVREQKIAHWLGHLQNWKRSGDSLSAYTRSQGLAAWSVYHWREVLRREGRSQEIAPAKHDVEGVPLRLLGSR